MKKVTIEGNILILENRPFHTRRFEIVENVNRSYRIWNINMAEGYIPYCQMLDNVRINPETLKAIKIKWEQETTGYISKFLKDLIK